MAYVVETLVDGLSTNSSTFTPASLPLHITGDLLLLCVCQDIGGTAISTATAGWADVGSQAQANGARSAWFWKIAASASETIPAFAGTNESWSVLLLAIRGADTTPIHQVATSSWNTSYQSDSPALTTTIDNCLIIKAMTGDGYSGVVHYANPDELVYLGVIGYGEHIYAGWKVQVESGVVPTIKWNCTVNTEGGLAWTIAIKGTGERGTIPGYIKGWLSNNVLGRLHRSLERIEEVEPGDATSITDLTAIDGVTIADEALYTSTSWYKISTPAAATQAALGGFFFTPRETFSLANSIIAINYLHYGAAAALIGRLGVLLVFVDSSDDWAAFTLATQPELSLATIGNFLQWYGDTGQTPAYSSGTVDFSAIAKVGILLHHLVTTSARSFDFGNFVKISPAIYIGGSPNAPSSLSSVGEQSINLWSYYDLHGLQGTTQLKVSSSIQIGDGSTPTYLNTKGTSVTSPQTYRANDRKRNNYRVAPNTANFVIKAGADDEILLEDCVIVAEQIQQFSIDSTSHLDATYGFSGLVLSGWEVTWKTGINCTAASFSKCYEVHGKAASFVSCRFSDHLATPAISLESGATLTDCTFVSAGTGHAVEFTTAGTYTVTDTTFTGYGIAGTANATFLNSSGGAVTVNISGSGTPTITNSSGSTTTLAAPQATLTIVANVSLVGAEVRIYDLDGLDGDYGTELDGVESHNAATFVLTDEVDNLIAIQIMKDGYEELVVNHTIANLTETLNVTLILDRNA